MLKVPDIVLNFVHFIDALLVLDYLSGVAGGCGVDPVYALQMIDVLADRS